VTDESSVITPAIVLITGYFSYSTDMLKFCGKGQIPRLGSKIPWPAENCGPYRSVYHTTQQITWKLSKYAGHQKALSDCCNAHRM